jgi:flagellar basal-body rod protein FlgG
MLAQQLNVEVISNNLANLSTTAYKRQRAEFKDLLYQTQQRAGSQGAGEGSQIPSGIQLGLGVRPGAVYRINEQGAAQETGNPLDVMVQGKGYFVVTLPNGENAYTRSGAFQLSPEGEIITQEGNTVSPGISLPENAENISVSQTGVVQYKLAGQTAAITAGTLELVNFINPNGLEATGDNLFIETTASGEAQTGQPGDEGFGTILGGYLENSNVDPVKEITTLISAQRAYEMNSKVISASDEMLRTAAQIRS